MALEEHVGSIARVDAGRSRGTAFLIAPRLLLTALHVVARRRDPPEWHADIVVRFGGGPPLKADPIRVAYSVKRDWALLKCDGSPAGAVPVGVQNRSGVDWETYGYPALGPDGMAIGGTVRLLAASGLIQLYSEELAAGKGGDPGGLSGAPCVVDGVAVGILVSALTDDDWTEEMLVQRTALGTLYACPIEQVLDAAAAMLPAELADNISIPDPYMGLPRPDPAEALPASPYRNLDAFTRQQAELFYGRGAEIRELYRRVTLPHWPPVILLYGQSGVGKSSLLEAGLQARIKSAMDVVPIRRNPNLGLGASLAAALGRERPEEIGEAWRAREKDRAKPVLLILDQAEECFTRQIGSPTNELRAFARTLRTVLAEEHAQGRLIVALRKEWLPEFRAEFDNHGLNFGDMFVDRLRKAGIEEAIVGPTRSERLTAKYKLTIERELVQALVADLMRDPDSPIATILQLTLGRLWDDVADRDARAFTKDAYGALRAQGLKLPAFLDRQLAALDTSTDAFDVEHGKSGLALDILYYHVTRHDTAETRLHAEVLQEYRNHSAATVEKLLERLKDLRLLVDVPLRGRATRLAHDTLSPTVRAAYDLSTRPGQVARRILEHHVLTR